MTYEKVKYPDGQISVKVLNWVGYAPDGIFKISERVNSYEDLFYLKSIADAIRSVRPDISIDASIPCLFGQRSDRRFGKGHSFDLKIIADFINSCGFRWVETFDPHSDVSGALINGACISGPQDFVTAVVGMERSQDPNSEVILISPDAGAYKKVFKIGTEINVPVIGANKCRTKEGGMEITIAGDVTGKTCLIVDDICDGGRTFITLGQKLSEMGANRVSLYVSHGYFSNGLYQMLTVLDHIYCTNSVKDMEDTEFLTQFKVI